MSRIIREAKPANIPEIIQVMEAAKKIMRQSGNMHQWGDGYPSEAVIISDMEKHGGYIIEEGDGENQSTDHIVGYFAWTSASRVMQTSASIPIRIIISCSTTSRSMVLPIAASSTSFQAISVSLIRKPY